MAMPAISIEKIDDLKDAAFRDAREQRELITMGIITDTVDDYVTAEYNLLAPLAGLDAVTKPRIAVWVHTLEGLALHGVYEFDARWPMEPDYLKELGKMWEALAHALEGGDGSIPWSGELLVDPIEV
jgi:hypothetical protein